MKTPNLFRTLLATLAGLPLLGPVTAQAADVSEYGVLKGRTYSQSEAGTPGDDFVFYWWYSYVRMAASDSVTEATVLPPGAEEPLPLYLLDDPLLLQLNLPALSQSDLNTAYPNGNYVVAMTTAHEGNRNVTLGLTGDSYPNTPTFQNFSALETVNPAAAYMLSWSAFSGGTANDFIQVRIVDGDNNQVFLTPALGVAGALSGTATSVAVPASTLAPESFYTVMLTFTKVITRNTTSYAGVTGLAGYFKSTETSLTTTAGSGGTDTTPPQLTSTVPINGTAGVSVNSPILFTFNEAMAEAQSIAWSANVNVGNLFYNWSGDGRTLTCVYLGSLPAGATITWALNASGQPQDFKDVAGNPLPTGTYSGSFSTAGSTNNPCEGGGYDGEGIGGVSKELNYFQTSAAAPVPDPERPAVFLGSTTTPTNNPITAARLQVPGGPLLTLTNLAGLGHAFMATEHYASQATLDTARPNGTYNLQLTRTTTTPSANISLNASYPPTPQILNYAAAQAVDASANFVLQWNGFTGAAANDSIGLLIAQPLTGWYWVAPDVCVPRLLANTATSITIPAGTLQPGTTYEVSLTYSRMTHASSNSIPDMVLAAFLRKSVNLTLQTTGGSGGGARFISFRQLPNGKIELRLQGTPGKSYMIRYSSNLKTWTDLTSHLATGDGVITIEISPGTYGSPAFFRAREL